MYENLYLFFDTKKVQVIIRYFYLIFCMRWNIIIRVLYGFLKLYDFFNFWSQIIKSVGFLKISFNPTALEMVWDYRPKLLPLIIYIEFWYPCQMACMVSDGKSKIGQTTCVRIGTKRKREREGLYYDCTSLFLIQYLSTAISIV